MATKNSAMAEDAEALAWFAIPRSISGNKRIMGLDPILFRSFFYLMTQTILGTTGALPLDEGEWLWPGIPYYSEAELKNDVEALIERGLIVLSEDGHLVLAPFAGWQPGKTKSTKERAANAECVRRHRAKKRQQQAQSAEAEQASPPPAQEEASPAPEAPETPPPTPTETPAETVNCNPYSKDYSKGTYKSREEKKREEGEVPSPPPSNSSGKLGLQLLKNPNKVGPQPDPLAEDFEDWCETVWIRHPHAKKSLKHVVFKELAEKGFTTDLEARALFDRNHELWCQTLDWRKNNGTWAMWLVDPKLNGAGFVCDDIWRFPPSQEVVTPDSRSVYFEAVGLDLEQIA